MTVARLPAPGTYCRMAADAESLNELANELTDEGRYADAEGAFRRAIEASPDWSVPWFNLGLMFKIQRRWHESADCNRRAVELDSSNMGAWWNLGIAATACGDWQEARRAWRGYGLTVGDGEGPLHESYGAVPLRLNPDGSGEVVWARRIDPARAIIESVPLPGSGFCEGDTVLHDGDPKGKRRLGEREVSVFNVFQVLERSGRQTYETHVTAETEGDVNALTKLAEDNGCVAEDWTETVHVICRECSDGIPHTEHSHTQAPREFRRRVGISAASMEQASAVLMQWETGAPARRLIDIRPSA